MHRVLLALAAAAAITAVTPAQGQSVAASSFSASSAVGTSSATMIGFRMGALKPNCDRPTSGDYRSAFSAATTIDNPGAIYMSGEKFRRE